MSTLDAAVPSHPSPRRDVLVRRTERWFVRQGVPHLIANYGFRTHVLPRMRRVRAVYLGLRSQ